MRKLFVAGLVLMLTAPASADFWHGAGEDAGVGSITRLPGRYDALGGEFTLTGFVNIGYSHYDAVARDGNSVQTFCVEVREYVQVGQNIEGYISHASAETPDIYGSGSHAWEGGAPGVGDTLSSETAYLFTKFATGELDGYVYTDGSDRSASAEALQRVIWYFEGEIDASEINDGLDSTQQTLAAGWKSDAETVVSEGDWVGIGLVRVIQMAQPPGSTSPDQDQLVLVSAPAAAVLGLLGVGGFAALRRRFR